MKVSKVKTKTVVETVEEEVKETTLEKGVKKYIRKSGGGHFVVRTEKEEAFCCLGIKVDEFLYATRHSDLSRSATAEGEEKERYWMVITTEEVVMLDAIPYSKHPSWNDEDKMLSNFDEENEENEE